MNSARLPTVCRQLTSPMWPPGQVWPMCVSSPTPSVAASSDGESPPTCERPWSHAGSIVRSGSFLLVKGQSGTPRFTQDGGDPSAAIHASEPRSRWLGRERLSETSVTSEIGCRPRCEAACTSRSNSRHVARCALRRATSPSCLWKWRVSFRSDQRRRTKPARCVVHEPEPRQRAS